MCRRQNNSISISLPSTVWGDVNARSSCRVILDIPDAINENEKYVLASGVLRVRLNVHVNLFESLLPGAAAPYPFDLHQKRDSIAAQVGYLVDSRLRGYSYFPW